MPAKSHKSADGAIRTFIAIELPKHVQSGLKNLQEEIKEYRIKITWTRPENIHLTLKFLGDIKPEMVPSIGRIIETAARECPSMELSSKAIGFFPSVKRPRVLWTGIYGQTEALAGLYKKLEVGLSALGFPMEPRTFTAHLTLGRFKGGGTAELFIDMMKKFQDVSTDTFIADSLILFKSKLLPSGPVYSKLLSVPLTTENSIY